MDSLRKYIENHKVLVAAHRGASGEAPENTLAAFEAAIAGGADMIEVDVRISADGVAFASHDPNGGDFDEKEKTFSEALFETIRKIDVGSKFAKEFAGERVPSLREVVECVKDRAFLIVEIKSFEREFGADFDEAILDVVLEANYFDKTVFASFNPAVLRHIKAKVPEAIVAAIYSPKIGFTPGELIRATAAEAFICSVEELSEELISDVRSAGAFAGCYGADDADSLQKAIDFEICAIGTDFPSETVAELRRRGLRDD